MQATVAFNQSGKAPGQGESIFDACVETVSAMRRISVCRVASEEDSFVGEM